MTVTTAHSAAAQAADAAAERAATTLAVLQHDSATGCACTDDRP